MWPDGARKTKRINCGRNTGAEISLLAIIWFSVCRELQVVRMYGLSGISASGTKAPVHQTAKSQVHWSHAHPTSSCAGKVSAPNTIPLRR